MKALFSFFLLVLPAMLLSACGGGGSGATGFDTTQAITLNSTTHGGSNPAFNAYLMEETSPLNGIGIILLHGRGGNPDSAVVKELRRDLNARGYTTLSLQGPVPSTYTEGGSSAPPYTAFVAEVDTIMPEAYARIKTAIDYLKDRNVTKVVVIGFSLGSRMISAYTAYAQDATQLPVIGMAGIGMYGALGDPVLLDTRESMKSISLPVLDLYGSIDTNAVNSAAARLDNYTTHNGSATNYTQTQLTCGAITSQECHRLDGLKGTSTSPLETAVSNWVAAL